MNIITKQTKNKIETTVNKQDKFIVKILENIDKVCANEWEMYTNLGTIFPQNLFTKKRYKGFNVMALYLDTIVNSFSSSKYATFNSISKAGGKLKKGAKGCVIEFFSYIFKHKEMDKYFTLEQIKMMSEAERHNINIIPCVKNYTVFNSEFIENLSEINIDIENTEPTVTEIIEQENCEMFISKIISIGNLNLQFRLNEIAFYFPSLDLVQLPPREYFLSSAKYYSVLFHEIIHWTGNKNRLNRDLKGHRDILSYSFEELIAEMGSMLMCLQFGILDEFINSIRYLKGWSSKNNTDKETNLRNAFIHSKKAKKFLENFQD